MKCNNKHCLWSAYGSCCPESEDLIDRAIPNALDCPSSSRSDIEKQLINLYEECRSLLRYRNMSELVEIKNFIEAQRENKK